MRNSKGTYPKRADDVMRRMLHSAGKALVLRGLGAGLSFLLSVAIGRLLGAEGAGLYFLSLSVVSIGAVAAKLGLDNALLRLVASGAAQNDWGQVRAVFSTGMRAAAAASFAAGLALAIAAPWLAEAVFHKPALAMPLRLMSFGIFTFSMMTLLAESLKGLQLIAWSMAVSGLIFPIVALAVLWPLTRTMDAAGATLAYLIGTGSSALVGYWLWHRGLAGHDGPDLFDRKVLLDSARPLWLMTLINRAVLPWLPLFLLGIWGGTQDSGIFGAATRLAMIVSLFLTSVNTVIAPKFAKLHANGDIETVARIARRFALVVTLAASPLFLTLVFAGSWVMSLFGPDFAAGGKALAILAVGQAINTATGSVGYLLMMAGYERDSRNGALLAVPVLIAVAAIAMPSDAMIGAALASTAAVATSNLYAAAMVKRRLGFYVVPTWSRRT